MTVLAIRADGVGKRYGSKWALRNCTVEIPVGSVTALVGPNGAGKTTLLQLAVGLLRPTEGAVHVLGRSPRADASELLPRIGFLAQDHPLHRSFTIADMLAFGRRLNPRWDEQLARERLDRLGLALSAKAGRLSGGEQAQVALTLALAKRPELLVLDEPVASLDPLARREFLSGVLEAVTESGLTVILSSHIVGDLERFCDHLVILAGARTLLAAPIDEVLATHRLLTGPRAEAANLAPAQHVIRASHTPRQTSLLVRTERLLHDSVWESHELDLEEVVLAYLGRDRARGPFGKAAAR